jgi:hypothetical protein
MAQNPTNIEFIITYVDAVTNARTKLKLDIEQTTDFPLAITYSIKDVQDPESSKGSYSKTFSIPATKLNNTTLKNLYSDSLYQAFQYVEEYTAQIYVDGLVVLEGKFNIKGTTYNNIPQSYECVVFGENYKWVNALSELNLCDINFNAGGFFGANPTIVSYNKTSIENTWQFNQAGEIIGGVGTHIVYPLVNTGRWNYQNQNGDAVVTPSDMMPSFYIYNIIKCIFAEQGYTITSDFFETEYFKRLTSLLPKQDFTNSVAVLTNYAFEYEDNSVNWSDWKIPLNYNNTSATPNDCAGAIGNTWHGQMNDLGLVTPTSDPSNLITTQTLSPNFDDESPTNFGALQSLDMRTIAGWYWGCYGEQQGSQPRITWNWTDDCDNANTNVGLNFGCVSCDIFQDTGSPTNTTGVTMSASTFQTPFLGLYAFNCSQSLQMENAYELNNPVEPYDDAPPNVNDRGTGNGGADYPCIINTSGAGVDGYSEALRGTTYVFNMHLIHYKASTGKYHIVATDSKRKLNPSGFFPNFYCDGSPLSGVDLTESMGLSNIQLEILSADDKVFVYSEVTCEKRLNEYSSQFASEQIIGLTQMKYRVNSNKFSGGLLPDLIDGASVDLASMLPCDTKQLDWVNGLTGMFNLFWQSNEATKEIIVEPRGNFFSSPDKAIDWTKKVDHLNDHTNEFIYDALKRNLCFTYENDSTDGFVEERNRRRAQKCELGSHSLNLGDLYVDDEQKIGTEFYSPTYQVYDKTISNNNGSYRQPFIPIIHTDYNHIWSNTENWQQPNKIDDFAPRILCWYGLQPLNQLSGASSFATWRWGSNADSWATWDNLNTYPFGGVYCDQDGTLGGSLSINNISYPNPSLYFENSDINAFASIVPYEKTDGLYNMFWEQNILSMLSRPKIKTIYAKLSTNDIATIDFRKLIFIESPQANTYWILNKIIDYKVGKNELTKVELYEYSNTRILKNSFPTIGLGNGVNDTGQHTDFNAEPVNDGKYKIASNEVANGLGMSSTTRIPLANIGTNSPSLPQYQYTPIIGGKSTSTNYFDDGTRAPITGKNTSSNIGNNENIDVGSISIGNNQLIQNSNKIVIGDGNNSRSSNNIELTANGRTAFGIKSDGIFREGGGGVVYFEDASGEIREVMTGVPIGILAPIFATGRKYFYTRLTIGDE